METNPKTIPEVIRNDAALYEGDLIHYFRILFNFAQNLRHPYHNFRHMFHVMWLCHDACRFYRDVLTQREMRNLLIAALFHDFDHSGLMGNDHINIRQALRGLRKHIAPIDAPYLETIIGLITATQYPYILESEKLGLCGKIIRDADMSQSLNSNWIQHVIFGLAEEWGKKPIDVLKMQTPFFRSLNFQTEWARRQFPQSDVDAKTEETLALLELLEPNKKVISPAARR